MTENEELLRWVPPTRLYDASPSAAPIGEAMTKISSTMIVYAVVDDALSARVLASSHLVDTRSRWELVAALSRLLDTAS